jgi:hypothetical protein
MLVVAALTLMPPLPGKDSSWTIHAHSVNGLSSLGVPPNGLRNICLDANNRGTFYYKVLAHPLSLRDVPNQQRKGFGPLAGEATWGGNGVWNVGITPLATM